MKDSERQIVETVGCLLDPLTVKGLSALAEDIDIDDVRVEPCSSRIRESAMPQQASHAVSDVELNLLLRGKHTRAKQRMKDRTEELGRNVPLPPTGFLDLWSSQTVDVAKTEPLLRQSMIGPRK